MKEYKLRVNRGFYPESEIFIRASDRGRFLRILKRIYKAEFKYSIYNEQKKCFELNSDYYGIITLEILEETEV